MAVDEVYSGNKGAPVKKRKDDEDAKVAKLKAPRASFSNKAPGDVVTPSPEITKRPVPSGGPANKRKSPLVDQVVAMRAAGMRGARKKAAPRSNVPGGLASSKTAPRAPAVESPLVEAEKERKLKYRNRTGAAVTRTSPDGLASSGGKLQR